MAKTVDEALFEITPKIQELADLSEKNNAIDKELFTKYEVKRGLRDLNGLGCSCKRDCGRKRSTLPGKPLLPGI